MLSWMFIVQKEMSNVEGSCFEPAIVTYDCNHSAWKTEAKDHEFITTLGYVVNSSPAWA